MKITKLLLTAIIISALCILSNYSDKSNMVESFDRIVEDSTQAYSNYVYPSNSNVKPTDLEKMSWFISSYRFDTLNEAMKAHTDNILVGVEVLFNPLKESKTSFFDNKISKNSQWNCVDAEGHNVGCQVLDKGYPESITSVAFATKDLICMKSSCEILGDKRAVSKRVSPSDLLTSKVVVTVSNDSGEFTATSIPVNQMITYPSSWVSPIRINRVHAIIQTNAIYDKYPNSGKGANINIVSVEDDLSELIMIEDKVKEASLGVSKSFIDKSLKADIENVEGLSAISIINLSINTIGLMAPLIAFVIMVWSVLNLNKVDRRLKAKSALPEEVTDSIIYGSENLSRFLTMALLLFPTIMCILPPFLMPYEAFFDSASAFNLTFNEMLIKYEPFGFVPDVNSSGSWNITLIGVICAVINALLGLYCLHKIDKQRAIMAEIQESAGNNDVSAHHMVNYSYSAPSVIIDNLRI